jgi:hypothetical protein
MGRWMSGQYTADNGRATIYSAYMWPVASIASHTITPSTNLPPQPFTGHRHTCAERRPPPLGHLHPCTARAAAAAPHAPHMGAPACARSGCRCRRLHEAAASCVRCVPLPVLPPMGLPHACTGGPPPRVRCMPLHHAPLHHHSTTAIIWLKPLQVGGWVGGFPVIQIDQSTLSTN